MNPAHVLLALIVTALLAWSWAEAAEIAADENDAGRGDDPAGSAMDEGAQSGDPDGGEGRVSTLDVWLLRAILVVVDGAVWLGLALIL